MPYQIQFRRGTAAAWTSANPVLAAGERGLETDTKKTKMGDGSTAWAILLYESSSRVFPFSKFGPLAAVAGTSRVYNDTGDTLTIMATRASVGTAPTGAALIVDINKNGTTIFTTQSNRPTIAISGNTAAGGTPDVISWAAGEYLTVDIDQIGSAISGSDLVVQITVR